MALTAPRRSSMPDLSELFRHNLLTVILAHVFNAAGPQSVHGAILLRSLVRVSDKALEDYELSRNAFAAFVNRTSNNVLSPLFRAIGHMENCIGSIDRALRFVRRLREDAEFASVAFPPALVNKDVIRNVGILRNGTEHMDARVVDGTVAEGDLSTLWMDEDFIELEGAKVTYAELSEWLRQLQQLATTLAHFKPAAQPGAPGDGPSPAGSARA